MVVLYISPRVCKPPFFRGFVTIYRKIFTGGYHLLFRWRGNSFFVVNNYFILLQNEPTKLLYIQCDLFIVAHCNSIENIFTRRVRKILKHFVNIFCGYYLKGNIGKVYRPWPWYNSNIRGNIFSLYYNFAIGRTSTSTKDRCGQYQAQAG